MAEKMSGKPFAQVFKDLQARKFAPVYLLAGVTPYYIDKIADYIADNAIKEEERDFNQLIFYGQDTTPSQIMDASRGIPMMAEYQVIIVKEAQSMKGIEQLEKYFKSPSPSTILVICYKNEIKTKKGWVSEAEKNGVFFYAERIYDSKLPDFITGYLREKGYDIDYKAMQMIADHIGTDLSRMATELDKLIISMPEGQQKIMPVDVEEKIGISKDFNESELRAALIARNVEKANLIAKYLDKNPKEGDVHAIIPRLFTFFQNLMAAYYCPDKSNSKALAIALSQPEWYVRMYIMPALRNYKAVKTMQIISILRTTIAKSNGLDNRSATSGELLQELVYYILH